MSFIFIGMGGLFLFLNRKSTISILFSIEVMFFSVILSYASLLELGGFFLVMCLIVLSAAFSLAVFVKGLSKFSSESQQIFLSWGWSTLGIYNLHL